MKTKPHANKFKMVLAQCLEGYILRLSVEICVQDEEIYIVCTNNEAAASQRPDRRLHIN